MGGLLLIQNAVVHGPAVVMVGGEQVDGGAVHLLLGFRHLVLGVQKGVLGQVALAVLQLGDGVVVLLHRQSGFSRVQYLLVVLYLEIQRAEAHFVVLDGGVVVVLGRLPLFKNGVARVFFGNPIKNFLQKSR